MNEITTPIYQPIKHERPWLTRLPLFVMLVSLAIDILLVMWETLIAAHVFPHGPEIDPPYLVMFFLNLPASIPALWSSELLLIALAHLGVVSVRSIAGGVIWTLMTMVLGAVQWYFGGILLRSILRWFASLFGQVS